jgi:hypothetical protein
MKRVLAVIVLAMFVAPIIGCHADADVDHDSRHTEVKKTTVREPGGDVHTTRTEVHHD